ncbi:hypothetical protein F2Q69_00044460 [Brassica cretica]|uniref:Plastid lipid-associated protein/fibrillin conserved domain-containing protein n=1 Tax=Brassica cretica TaxID=69181 RepID=A0A8S9NUU8_BRACR|nr:hypothetical protein F2Q69_00044460 [Brassica cretica]
MVAPSTESIRLPHNPANAEKGITKSCLRATSLAHLTVNSPNTRNVTPTVPPAATAANSPAFVANSDGGVTLTPEQHKEVAQVAGELQKYCVSEPVKCPLIFGDWDVVYCSRPTSPGGGYRSVIGRLFFRTKEMIQGIDSPDTVRNRVSFTALGFLDGDVSLTGKLNVLDSEWVQVIFEPPELKVGSLEFKYGFESEVKLRITYVDEKLRLGIGSRGSLFVFRRRQ